MSYGCIFNKRSKMDEKEANENGFPITESMRSFSLEEKRNIMVNESRRQYLLRNKYRIKIR